MLQTLFFPKWLYIDKLGYEFIGAYRQTIVIGYFNLHCCAEAATDTAFNLAKTFVLESI